MGVNHIHQIYRDQIERVLAQCWDHSPACRTVLFAKAALVTPHHMFGHVAIARRPVNLAAQGLPRTLSALVTLLVVEGM
jgi:hypothetical protein|tara:strand:+ start:385 stop:621 length:237 start_codon:yes stop_codon:yes gene_type:complete